VAVYSKRPVEIAVTREDNGQPVANLHVEIDYAAILCLNIPATVDGVTDEQGRVLLPVADFEYGPVHLRVGDFGATLDVDTIRNGGIVNTTRWVSDVEEKPRLTVRLVPRSRSARKHADSRGE
jgi:hypothetical protein